jgi:hypothetical protein
MDGRVSYDTVVQAARTHLAAQTALTALLGSDSVYATWIFQWEPYVDFEGTSKVGVVLVARGGWTSRAFHNTASFPRLVVQIFADPTRDANRNVISLDARDKAWKVLEALDRSLHRPGGINELWGTVRVYQSHREDEPDWIAEPDGDGLVVCTVSYGLSVIEGQPVA